MARKRVISLLLVALSMLAIGVAVAQAAAYLGLIVLTILMTSALSVVSSQRAAMSARSRPSA